MRNFLNGLPPIALMFIGVILIWIGSIGGRLVSPPQSTPSSVSEPLRYTTFYGRTPELTRISDGKICGVLTNVFFVVTGVGKKLQGEIISSAVVVIVDETGIQRTSDLTFKEPDTINSLPVTNVTKWLYPLEEMFPGGVHRYLKPFGATTNK